MRNLRLYSVPRALSNVPWEFIAFEDTEINSLFVYAVFPDDNGVLCNDYISSKKFLSMDSHRSFFRKVGDLWLGSPQGLLIVKIRYPVY
jgi:hypothetical protein